MDKSNKLVEKGMSWILVFLLLVVGCSSDNFRMVHIATHGVFVPFGFELADVPIRSLLVKGEDPIKHYAAYGYVVFTKRPSTNDLARYRQFCRAYIRNLETIHEYDLYATKASFMVTHWLVTERVASHDPDDCTKMVEVYDYSHAKLIASTANGLAARGPLLIAWTKPYETVRRFDDGLVFNLSNFPNDRFDDALGIWMKHITLNEKVWNDGITYQETKARFLKAFDQYGDSFFRLIATWRGKQG